MRLLLLRSGDFQTAHGYSGVAAVQVGLETGTGLELELVVWFVQGPDAGKAAPRSSTIV